MMSKYKLLVTETVEINHDIEIEYEGNIDDLLDLVEDKTPGYEGLDVYVDVLANSGAKILEIIEGEPESIEIECEDYEEGDISE